MASVASTSTQAAAVTDEAKSLLLGQLTLLATLSGLRSGFMSALVYRC